MATINDFLTLSALKGFTMTVSELMERLSTLNPNQKVLIEVNHGDMRSTFPGDVEELRISKWGSIVTEEDDGEDVVVIKA
tara:strand:+ start:62 stop:301 length:240 start_codon:yes stop_codon:yes gene_type:complete